jgi:hypothetical protein
MILSGAAGGAALHAFMPDQPAVRQAEMPAAPTASTLTNADLTAAEQRLLARFREEVGEVNARVLEVSNRSILERPTGDHAALSQEVLTLRSQNQKLTDLVTMFVNNLDQVSKAAETKTTDLQVQMKNLQALVQQLVSGTR